MLGGGRLFPKQTSAAYGDDREQAGVPRGSRVCFATPSALGLDPPPAPNPLRQIHTLPFWDNAGNAVRRRSMASYGAGKVY